MKRAVETLVGKLAYDPDRPQTWTVSRLLGFAKEHGVEVMPGTEKPELVKLADNLLANDLLRAKLKEKATLNEAKVNVLITPAEKLLEYKAYPEYAAALRKDVGKLKEILRVGMERLVSLKAITDLRSIECHPPVEAWLYIAATGTDNGKTFHDVLTKNSTSSVCGKILPVKDMIVRCMDCASDNTCVFCMECFQNSPCRSHRYTVSMSGGGMCDCGDPDAWKPESFCTRHRGLREGDDPTVALGAADKEWVTTIIRGMVQFVALVLQQSLRLEEKLADLRKEEGLKEQKGKGAHAEETRAESYTATEEACHVPAEDDDGLAKVLPFLNTHDCTADWLFPVAKALAGLSGDCTKRLLTNAWAELALLPSASAAASDGAKEASCLEVLFLFQLNRDGQRLVKDEQGDTWWKTLLRSVGACLTDPTMRVLFAALYLTYSERITRSKGSLQDFAVQFMTNRATVGTLLLASPSLLPYKNPHDTILHRALSSIVFTLVVTARDPKSDSTRKLPDALPSWLFRIRWSTNRLTIGSVLLVTYALSVSREAADASVLSRSYLRVLFQIFLVLQASADIRQDPEMATNESCDAQWIGSLMNRSLWSMQNALRRCLRRLAHGGEGFREENLRRLLVALERSETFDSTPDPRARCDGLEAFLRGAVTQGDPSSVRPAVLPVDASGGALGYVTAYMAEVLRGLDAAMLLQRAEFQKVGYGNTTVVLSRPSVPIHAYHLMRPAKHSTSFLNPLVRIYCLAVRAWVMEQRMAQVQSAEKAPPAEGGNATQHSSSGSATHVRMHGLDVSSLHGAKPPLASITALAFAGEANLQRRESVLDSLVMPFVLMSQLELGWWARGDCNAMEMLQRYLQHDLGIALYQDIYMLQVLTLHTPTQDFALRLLERFCFKRPRDGDAAKGGARRRDGQAALRPGWAGFFRLMLTIVTDTSKANRTFLSEFSPTMVKRVITYLLSLYPMAHSRIVDMVRHSFQSVDLEDPGTDEDSPRLEDLARTIIAEVAESEERPNGRVFHLKSLDVWRDNVDIYNPTVLDSEVPDALLPTYSRLSVMEQLKARQKAGVSANEEEAASGEKPKTPRLPPTALRTNEQYEELVPSLRALLHTDALLVTAIQIVLQHAHNLRRAAAAERAAGHSNATPHTPAGSGNPSAPDVPSRDLNTPSACESETEEDTSASDVSADDSHGGTKRGVSKVLLLHAITALYLCVRDCVSLSQAALNEIGVQHEEPAAGDVGDVPEIDWGHVEAYVRDSVSCTHTFSEETVKALFDLPELMGPQCVKAKLECKVPVSRFGAPAAPQQQQQQQQQQPNNEGLTYTAAEALHEIRQYFHDNEKEDSYSFCDMIDFILLGTRLAQFSPQANEEELAAATAQAKSRQQLVKDKQAKLLAQLRRRGAKQAAAVTDAAVARGTNPKASGGTTEEEAASPQVHTTLLLELTSLECCVCRCTTEEPLMLLANTSTSGVLHHLRATQLPDKRTVHSHFSICGHAVHKACSEKVFSRLAQLWQRRYFQGEAFLGSGEFSCPICVMICTSLCPVPVLRDAPSSPAEKAEKPATLFEDVRRGTLEAAPQAVQESCDSLHNALAQACIGISFAGEDSTGIVQTEDPLQRAGSKAWQLSETLRSVGFHLQVMLESTKASLDVNAASIQRDCIALLALLVSVNPSSLAKHKKELEENFTRTREDYSLLLLRVLLEPRKASAHIAAYAVALAASSEPIKRLVDACTASAPAAQREDGGDENKEEEEVADAVGNAAVAIAVWKELGCLTLLKLMVSDEGSASSTALVVVSAKTASGEGPQQQLLRFVALDSDRLATARGRRDAIRCMWCFVSCANATSSPSMAEPGLANVYTRLAPLLVLSTTATALSPYVSPQEYQRAIVGSVLRMPLEYMDILTRQAAMGNRCSTCGKRSDKPVVCCYCGEHFCCQPKDTAPELYAHSRACGSGVGLYILIRATGLIVLDAVAGRVLQYPPIYTDEHGEMDMSLARGNRLTRNDAAAHRFLLLWLRNRWGVDSATVKGAWRVGVKRM